MNIFASQFENLVLHLDNITPLAKMRHKKALFEKNSTLHE